MIRTLGNVPENEMRRVFNLGVGFCVVVAEAEAERTLAVLSGLGCPARRIGTVTRETGVSFA